MARAPERAIWTTRDVLERSNTTFETTALEPLSLKGKSRPVEAVALGAIGAPACARSPSCPSSTASASCPFSKIAHPREDGIRKLRRARRARRHRQVSRARRSRDRSGGLPVVATACEQYEATTPYFAFRRLLETELDLDLDGSAEANSDRLTSKLEPVAPKVLDWLPLLGDVLDVPVGSTRQVDELQPSFRRARLNGVVEELLANLFDSPTLLLFEEHALDGRGVLGSASPSRHPRAVEADGYLRYQDARAHRLRRCRGNSAHPRTDAVLARFRRRTKEARTGCRRGRRCPPCRCRRDRRTCRWKSLFVRELVAATALEPGQTETLPDNVEGVVAARIDSLAPGDRALLRWASVLGATFSGEIVAHVLEGDPDAALDSESWDRLGEFVRARSISGRLVPFPARADP